MTPGWKGRCSVFGPQLPCRRSWFPATERRPIRENPAPRFERGDVFSPRHLEVSAIVRQEILFIYTVFRSSLFPECRTTAVTPAQGERRPRNAGKRRPRLARSRRPRQTSLEFTPVEAGSRRRRRADNPEPLLPHGRLCSDGGTLMKPPLFAFRVAAHLGGGPRRRRGVSVGHRRRSGGSPCREVPDPYGTVRLGGRRRPGIAKAVSDLLEEEAAHCGRKSHAEAAEADNANRCIEVPGDTYTSAGEVAYRSAAALRNVCSETAHVAMWSWSNAAGKPGVAVQGTFVVEPGRHESRGLPRSERAPQRGLREVPRQPESGREPRAAESALRSAEPPVRDATAGGEHRGELEARALTAKVCPECWYVFKGNGWDGIDAHWRPRHEDVMPYAKGVGTPPRGKVSLDAKYCSGARRRARGGRGATD